MKNIIIKTICYAASATFVLGACCIDSDSPIPLFMIVGSLIVLIPIAYANKDRLLPKED